MYYTASQQDADHTAAALVDDSGQHFLHLLPGVGGHLHQLVVQAFPHHVAQALAEEVGAPDLLRIALELIQQVFHQLLAAS